MSQLLKGKTDSLFKGFFLLGLLLISVNGNATSASQAHARTGMVTVSASGSVTGSFSSMPIMDGEFEFFQGYRKSNVFRMILATDPGTGVTRYFYSGTGWKWYSGGLGMLYEESTPETTISIAPRFRWFTTAQLGISQIAVKSLGAVLSITSTALDFGGGGGFNSQLTKNVSIEGQIEYAFGYGFSSVAVMASVIRLTFGLCYLY